MPASKDGPRAGDFAPLASVPKYKSVVLGFVGAKTPELEDGSIKFDCASPISKARKMIELAAN